MKGLEWDNPYRIRTWKELVNWINETGFLPLFANETEGFSAEEHVSRDYWWTGIVEEDPWEWLPYFANARRDGYDFDARWADGLADRKEKLIMDFYMDEDESGDVVWKKDIQTHMKRIS